MYELSYYFLMDKIAKKGKRENPSTFLKLCESSQASSQISKFLQRTSRYLHGRTCALLKKLIEIQGSLLLTFFIYLHNQLSSLNSIIVQMSEKT